MRRPPSDRDERLVENALASMKDLPPALGPLPDPSFLWWKAQVLRQFDAQARVSEPIAVTDRLHVAAAVLGAVAVAAGAWSQTAADSSDLTSVVVMLGAAIAISCVSMLAWSELHDR